MHWRVWFSMDLKLDLNDYSKILCIVSISFEALLAKMSSKCEDFISSCGQWYRFKLLSRTLTRFNVITLECYHTVKKYLGISIVLTLECYHTVKKYLGISIVLTLECYHTVKKYLGRINVVTLSRTLESCFWLLFSKMLFPWRFQTLYHKQPKQPSFAISILKWKGFPTEFSISSTSMSREMIGAYRECYI